MADGQTSLRDVTLNLAVEIEQADRVRNDRTTFPDVLRNIFLAKVKLFSQAPIGICLLNRIQILALEVFDQSQFEDVTIGGLADDHGSFLQSQLAGGSPSAFAGDDFAFTVNFSDDKRLNDPVLSD